MRAKPELLSIFEILIFISTK